MPARPDDPFLMNQDERKPIVSKEYMNTGDFEYMKPLVLTLLPWFEFSMLSFVILFTYNKYPLFVWFAILLLAVLSISYVGIGLFLQRRGGRFYVVLGMLCLMATAFAVVIGFYTYFEFMVNYIADEERHIYVDVRPDEEALSHTDAGRLIFSEDAALNVEHAVGYLEDGTTYCVVPVAGETPLGTVQFWAVGQDCCKERKTFKCDDAEHDGTRTGVVLLRESSPFSSNLIDQFQKAVAEAEGAYGIQSAADAIFVRWIAEPNALAASYWNCSVGILLVACVLYLLLSLVLGSEAAFSNRCACILKPREPS
jgi:hypothetical protein